ncbi:hypothetical protein EG327_008350 [Venturia inaequalis]|uniref:AHC1-like C2H2 zinc-finger domain-containing protein n=1 Tax=Venturia inaequalis TaxID=5025 RepID=A0A8H3YZW8_VENIN|nr:hypothetical protein EG327_008350 [Venturia inaequalis]
MQGMFRLNWAQDAEHEKHGRADKAFPQQKARIITKPRIDIPVAHLTSTLSKRKRIDSSVDCPLPKHPAQLIKKAKTDVDGAVQPALLPSKGPDGVSAALASLNVAALGHNAVKSQELASASNVAATESQVQVVPAAPGVKTESPKAGSGDSSIVISVQEQPSAVAKPASLLTAQLPPHASLPSRSAVTNDSSSMSASQVNVDKLRAVIEAQLNLEILHKHNELRLIEQELAKCQIGLEQLRRCEVIPYPGLQSPSMAVSSGTGPSIQSPAGYSSPSSPAPWGVTDSPYARHYAKWLVPDPAFDPTLQVCMDTPMSARGTRATRGSGVDLQLPPPGRHSRMPSSASRSQAQGDVATSGARPDPMVLKRQVDDQWVRLKCIHCLRSDFNNVQGFLNHCRIAHHQEYKSHEAAAIACGEIVQLDESQLPAPKPVIPERPRAERASVVNTSHDQVAIDPLITNEPKHSPIDRVLPHTLSMTLLKSPATSGPSAPNFGSLSSLAPHLAKKMMQDKKLKHDVAGLDDAIRETRMPVDTSAWDNTDDEQDDKSGKKVKKQKTGRHSSSGQNILPPQVSMGEPRAQSHKGHRAASQAPAQPQQPARNPSPPTHGPSKIILKLSAPRANAHRNGPSDGDVDMDLSPGTVDASMPDLEPDHSDDDEDVSEADSSPGSPAEPEMMEDDVDIVDASDLERESGKRLGLMDGQVCRREGEGGSGMC